MCPKPIWADLICRSHQHYRRQWLPNTEWLNCRRWAWASHFMQSDSIKWVFPELFCFSAENCRTERYLRSQPKDCRLARSYIRPWTRSRLIGVSRSSLCLRSRPSIIGDCRSWRNLWRHKFSSLVTSEGFRTSKLAARGHNIDLSRVDSRLRLWSILIGKQLRRTRTCCQAVSSSWFSRELAHPVEVWLSHCW